MTIQDNLIEALRQVKELQESLWEHQSVFAEQIIEAAGIEGDLTDEQDQIIESAYSKMHAVGAAIAASDVLRELKETIE